MHRQVLLWDAIAAHENTPRLNLLYAQWLGLVLANACHLCSCYDLMKATDSVTICMLHGVQAVLVFVASGVLYCSASSLEQCFTVPKAVSCLVVFAGVLAYASVGKMAAAKSEAAAAAMTAKSSSS